MMDVTFRPAARNARTAASRPPPGPFTLTSMLLNPSAMASSAAFLADSVAANGVLFREPLNPKVPELHHEMVFPYLSVKVTMVLLKVALTKPIPSGSTFVFFFFFVCVLAKDHSPIAAFFLPATVFLRPFRVRALFLVFCPRVGNPLRCLKPR